MDKNTDKKGIPPAPMVGREVFDPHKVAERDLPCYTRCSVCHTIYVDKDGSTPCCGGRNEILYAEELEEMNIDPKHTQNAKWRTDGKGN